MKKKIAVMALLALLVGALYAEDIRVVVPYLGMATNAYQKTDPYYTIDWNDTKLMEGLYFQWINPDRFQANTFLYHSADINYSQFWGGHLIGDFYVLSDRLGKVAVGAGLEVLRLDTDAGDAESAQYIFDLKLPLTLYAPYARAGHYFYFGSSAKVLVSVFPWLGVEYDITRGDISLVADTDGPGPGGLTPREQSLDDETLYGLTGLSLSATIMHFIELQAKYKLTFNADDLLSTWDAMSNVFFTRHWGVSYRFKYMLSTSGSTSYHIGGIAYVF
jgi:opacity protein-like surface antigen